jgi:hypothetical protein
MELSNDRFHMTENTAGTDTHSTTATKSANGKENPASGEPRFLCDEMLRGLARWLRAAGYDTKTAEAGSADGVLLQQAYDEQRYLLTLDRKITQQNRSGANVIVLTCNNTDSCAHVLAQEMAINWLFRPFTRCLLCNSRLKTADPAMLRQVPKQSRPLADPLLYCPHCNKIYWDGSHVARMRQRLQKWANRNGSGE